MQEGGTYRLARRDDDGAVRPQRGPELVEELPVPRRAAAVDRPRRRRRRPRGRPRTPTPPRATPSSACAPATCTRSPCRTACSSRAATSTATTQRRREGAFIVAVNCGQAAATCFCVSMDTGPRATSGFDLALTEVLEDGGHRFVVEVGSERGAEVLAELPHRDAAAATSSQAAERAIENAAARAGRDRSTPTDIKDLLYRNLEHPRWDEVADRCLTCGNCTMVCPTCFCTHGRGRHRPGGRGGRARARSGTRASRSTTPTSTAAACTASTKARYRQWMTHKLATWIDQFGTSGCVGCGRCIAWCPVAIDITEEAAAIRATDLVAEARGWPMQTIDELLEEIDVFRGLADEHLDLIAGCALNRVFGDGEYLLPRASRPNTFFVIRHGTVALETYVPQRGAVMIETLHGGDVLGWSWLFPPYRTMFDARALGVVRTRRVRRRLPAREVRGGPAARLRADAALRRGHGASACRRRGCGCSTSMARSPVAERAREAGPMVPVPYRVARRRRETARLVDARARARRRRRARAVRARPVRDALRVRQGRGADLGQRDCRSVHTIRAVGAVSAALCDRAPRRRRSACAARSARRGRSRRPRAPTSSSSPAGSASRRCARSSTTCSRTASATAASSCSTAAAPRRSCSTRAELERWRGRFDVEVHVTVDQAGGRLARARRRGHDARAARRLRPGHTRGDDLRARGDDALRRRGAAGARRAGRARSSCRSSAA